MYIPFHLSTGFLLNQYLNEGKMMPAVLFFSIFPDIPYIFNFIYNGCQKKWRGMSRADIFERPLTWQWPAFTHSLVGLGLGGLLVGLWAPELISVFLIGYVSHLALDYPFHAPHYYLVLYPFSSIKFNSQWSYFDPDYHSQQINWGMTAVTAASFLFIFWR